MDANFAAVLGALMSKDNESRKNAESYFTNLQSTNLYETLAQLNLCLGNHSHDLVVRSFAGILIRRTLESVGEKLTDEQIRVTREQWLAMWAAESNHIMFIRLSHIMAQSALKKDWGDLLPTLFQHSASSNGDNMALLPVLGLVEIISEYCPEDISAHIQRLVPFLGQFIASPDIAVQIACAKATGACIICLDDEAIRNAFKPAILPIVNVLNAALTNGDEIDATKIMSYLVSIAQEQPNFFKGSLDAVVSAMLTVANAQGLEFSTRAMALELMVTITETAPALARRCAGLIQGLVPLAMSLMLEVEEEEAEWAAGPYTEEPSDENYCVDSATCDRVRGHAASALINLVSPESCEADSLARYLDPLLKSLLYCLQSAPLQVRPPCLSLLGCIATVSGEAFVPYYAGFMPGIISLLKEATSADLTLLRGKAMECAGLIGEAVGVQVFAADALEIMQLFMNALRMDTERDTTFEYILPACARISRALTTQFEPFLPALMDPLLAGAKQEIQFSMVDAQEDDIDGEVIQDEETGAESAVVSLGAGVRKRVTLNTHAVQQKNQAARVLYEFASALRGHLKGYILPALQILLTMVTDKHSADIRSSATLALGKMFEAFTHAVSLGFIENDPSRNISLDAVLSSCLSKLLEVVREESDLTARACGAEALRDVLQACYLSGTECEDGSRTVRLTPSIETSEKVVQEVLSRCAESLQRRQTKWDAIYKNDGYDEEDLAGVSQELAEEEDLLTVYADTFGQLLKLHGEPFMTEVDHFIAPTFSPYLRSDHPVALQIVAVYLVDDVVEFGGVSAHKYIPSLVSTFLHNAKSTNKLLRQCSVYGLAKAILAAPHLLIPHLGVVTAGLIDVLNTCAEPEEGEEVPEEDEEDESGGDNEGTFENAVFALGTLGCDPRYRDAIAAMGAGSVEHLVSTWLQRLPLRTDETQAKAASKQLCDAIERNDAYVLGQDG
eukprot:gene19768-22474_t